MPKYSSGSMYGQLSCEYSDKDSNVRACKLGPLELGFLTSENFDLHP